ncbi:AAA family ATPase [Roseibacterium sp. SDUM158016]|uniref:AAA family ATPase n=1 Tax=Roseicyclus sediminis TaxID=2980997 RepID=UPI0021D19E95|nr:AAA family ATPase [Roseibacterium sp. SDUM158016]MCU4654268.1 AAA family ATPase [Roseibacterium sp. SDUM158016]
MTEHARNIVLLAKDPKISAIVGRALEGDKDAVLCERDVALHEIGGSALEPIRKDGILIFRTDTGDDRDLAAVAALRREIGMKEPLIAITGADASLSEVRRLMQAGVSEVLPDSINAEEFRELLRKWTVEPTRNEPETGRMGRVIAVAQARGGVGSTTVAVNLADALLARGGGFRKRAGNRVALVDLDIQLGDVASFLDLEPNEALYELAVNGIEPDATFVAQSVTQLPSGLSVLTAPARFAPLDALKSAQIARLIDNLRKTHDYVVVDLPGGLVEWIDAVLERADRLLMVTDCAVPSIRQARRLIDFFSDAHLGLKIEVVINHEAKPMLLRRHHAAAEKVLEREFRHWLPDDPGAARAALDRGVPLSGIASRSRLSKTIARMARTLAEALAQREAAAETVAH